MMNNLLTRILMTIVMIPLASALYVAVLVLLGPQLQEEYAFLWTSIIVCLFVVLYWLGLWRRSVRCASR